MKIFKDGKTYNGLRIKLCHGAVVEWDGRIFKHCTTITDPGEHNDVIAVAFVATRVKVEDDNDIAYMRDPLVIKKNNEN